MEKSLNFGVFEGVRQVAYARVVTDTVSFAYIMDLFVDERYRLQGVASTLIDKVLEHPSQKEVPTLLLATKDAHALYNKNGFEALRKPEFWMQKKKSSK